MCADSSTNTNKYKRKNKKMKIGHLSHVTCYVSPVTCHLSPVTNHVTRFMCHLTNTLCSFSGYESPRRFGDAAARDLMSDKEKDPFLLPNKTAKNIC